MTRRRAVLSLLVLMVWQAACQTGLANSPTQQPVVISAGLSTRTPAGQVEAPTRPATNAAAATAGPAPTSVFALPEAGQTPGAAPTSLETTLPTPAPDPLRLVFPTPGAPQVSAWRPALYPVPWAPSPHDHFYFERPIAADEINWPVWDYRYGGTFLPDVVHTGIDIPTNTGTPVLAAGPGKVLWAGYGLYRGYEDTSDPYGIAVAIYHDFGAAGQPLFTVYGHLDRVDVVRGQQVEAGGSGGRPISNSS